LKIFDVEKKSIQESIFLNYKVVTAMDYSNHLVVAGQDNGFVKVFDLRK